MPDEAASPAVTPSAEALSPGNPAGPAEDRAALEEAPAQEAPAAADIKSSYRDALDRKTGRNSHAEQHLIGRQVGGGNNETHKRTFRRKSG